ncbi:hypothetical protein [Aquimarina spongiae]|nr:hypothetical protein [Aquimarina spongiae]
MKAMNTTMVSSKNNRGTKKVIPFLLSLLLTSLLFVGCKNDDNEILIQEILDGEELAQSIKDQREQAKQTTILNADTGGEVYGAEGTILYFGPNSFLDQNGDPVTGSVSIELIEIYDKAKMLLTKMPTNGKRPNGDVETLVSGGEFYVNATQDGSPLELANGFQLLAPTDQVDNEMVLFSAQDNDCDDTDLDCDVVWEEDDQGDLEIVQREGPNGMGVTFYLGIADHFGWTNIDRWFSDPRPKTVLSVDPPEGYDNTNSNVYISYDGEPGTLALLDIYDPDTGLFSEHYGLIPIGLEIHIIFVSVQDGQYVYAIQSATVEEDHVEVIGTTSTATEAELVAIINALP